MAYSTSRNSSLDPEQTPADSGTAESDIAQTKDSGTIALTRMGITFQWFTIACAVVVLALSFLLLDQGLVTLLSRVDNLLWTNNQGIMASFCLALIATVVMQSSSVVTMILVYGVSAGFIPVESAIIGVFGANLGTTVTPLLASFAFIRNRAQFTRAARISFTHVWFNLLGTAVLLPIELTLHPLQSLATFIAEPLATSIDRDTIDASAPALVTFNPWPFPIELTTTTAWVAVGVGGALFIFGLHAIARRTKALMAGGGLSVMGSLDGAADGIGIAGGALTTMAVGASSVTVSSVAAMGAVKGITTKGALAVVLGANIGTTLTGILTALSLRGPTGLANLQVALVHLLFNVTGTLLVLLIPVLKKIILNLSNSSAQLLAKNYLVGATLICVTWLGIPAALCWIF